MDTYNQILSDFDLPVNQSVQKKEGEINFVGSTQSFSSIIIWYYIQKSKQFNYAVNEVHIPKAYDFPRAPNHPITTLSSLIHHCLYKKQMVVPSSLILYIYSTNKIV